VCHRKKLPVRRTPVEIVETKAKVYDDIETYYNGRVKQIVADVVKEYNRSMTNKAKITISCPLINYYENRTATNNDRPLETFKDLVVRINTYLCRCDLITKMKCSYNTAARDKKDKHTYFVSYDFAFYGSV
jgi:hypothetical protein